MAEYLKDLMQQNNLEHAVDVGAGQGYLALELFEKDPQPKLVFAIECADIQVHGIQKRVENLNLENHSKIKIHRLNFDSSCISKSFEKSLFNQETVSPYLVYSLHACGSLSETILQLFVNASCSAKVLVNIGCCYNLIDEHLSGCHFPMSKTIQANWTNSLPWNMKMVACQAPYRWRLKPQKTKNFFKRHFYRSLFETLAAARSISEKDIRVGNIPDSALISFTEYVKHASSNMSDLMTEPSVLEIQEIWDKYQHLEKFIAFLWTMRALLGPVIESLILYDRMMFIRESCSNLERIEIVPLFDPFKSPRNMAIVAIKSNM